MSLEKKAWEIEGFLETGANGHLFIDGIDTIELAEKYDTPLFVFSENRIRHNIERLRRAENALKMPLKICYAAKANSNMGVLRAVRDAGSDIEVNSGGELFKALRAGFRPKQIIFNGTSKTERELTEAIDAGIYAIQADSLYEVEQIEKIAARLQKRANVSLRLVPEIETDTLHGLQTAMLTSKFGMLSAEVFAAFRRWHNSELVNLCGIHLHLGSQTPDATPFAEAFLKLFAHLKEIFDETGRRVEHLNLGGGFPVNYVRDRSNVEEIRESQRELFAADLEPAAVLQNAVRVVREAADAADAAHLLDNLTILLEPGRSVIADTGIVLTRVQNYKERPLLRDAEILNEEQLIKDNGQRTTDVWLLTDAGYNLLLSMVSYKWYYHLISASRAGEKHETAYKVAGPLCDGGDVYFDIEGTNRLPDHRLLPENVEPGEVLALLNAGAYTMAQMSHYNGRPMPTVVLINKNGEPEIVRRRDSYEDLLSQDF